MRVVSRRDPLSPLNYNVEKPKNARPSPSYALHNIVIGGEGGFGVRQNRHLLGRFQIARIQKLPLKPGFSRANRKIACLAIGRKKIWPTDTGLCSPFLSIPHIGDPIFWIFNNFQAAKNFQNSLFWNFLKGVCRNASRRTLGDLFHWISQRLSEAFSKMLPEDSGRSFPLDLAKAFGSLLQNAPRRLWKTFSFGSRKGFRKPLKIQ